MVKPVLIALVAGAAGALALLTLTVGAPGALVLANLTPLPLLIVGLGLGVVPAGIAGAGGTVIAGLLGGGNLAILFLGVFAVPTMLLVRQALLRRPAPSSGGADAAGGPAAEWYPVGSIVSLLATLVAAALVLGVTVGIGYQVDLREAVSGLLEAALALIVPDMDGATRSQTAAFMTPLFPGTVGTSWLLMLVVNGALAQGILVRAGRNLRPRVRYVTMTLPDWSSWLLVVAAAVTLLGAGNLEYMGQNLALVLAMPFFLLGLAVAHALARRLPQRGVMLGALYIVVLLSGWAALVVVGAGLVEQWVGIRRRFAAAGPQT